MELQVEKGGGGVERGRDLRRSRLLSGCPPATLVSGKKFLLWR